MPQAPHAQLATTQISVINESTVLTDADVIPVVIALQQQVTNDFRPIWGLDADGELANMFKPTAQKGLWFMGGGFAHARIYSHYVALQIKARMEGIPTPVYAMAPVHHRS